MSEETPRGVRYEWTTSLSDGRDWVRKRFESWLPIDFFCPACGGRPVWAQVGEGDYYLGVTHICLACGADFYLPTGAGVRKDALGLARLAALRAAAKEGGGE